MPSPESLSDSLLLRHANRREISDLASLQELVNEGCVLEEHVVHGVDVSDLVLPEDRALDELLLLGCTFADAEQRHAIEARGAYVFPRFKNLPYDPYRPALYSVDELFEGYGEGGYVGTCDFRIYEHFDRARKLGFGVSIREMLAQRIHDHAIDDALMALLEEKSGNGVVGIMGGHGTKRTDPYYRKVAYLTWDLTRRGYFIASGGGPGIMEAANLGAYLASYGNPRVLDAAIDILSDAPKFDGGEKEGTPEYLAAIDAFIARARDVVEVFFGEGRDREALAKFAPESEVPGESLAVPTWFYGHEPSNLFSTHIAKYFANSIREDGLLAISLGGVVFAPGSAGTLQEVFMDLAQNHYATFTLRSPMVFLGRERFASVHRLICDFIEEKGKREEYGDLVALFDDPMDVTDFILANPPRERVAHPPLYELVK
jgi:predicted Rossmann-fold nucleotide-binding protein